MTEKISFLTLAVFFGFLFDQLIGDPRNWPHPVVIIGKVIACLERRLNHGTSKARRVWGGANLFRRERKLSCDLGADFRREFSPSHIRTGSQCLFHIYDLSEQISLRCRTERSDPLNSRGYPRSTEKALLVCQQRHRESCRRRDCARNH